MTIDLSPALVPNAHACPVQGLTLDLLADADRVCGAYEVQELAMGDLAVVLRVQDATGSWLRVHVADDDFATWMVCD